MNIKALLTLSIRTIYQVYLDVMSSKSVLISCVRSEKRLLVTILQSFASRPSLTCLVNLGRGYLTGHRSWRHVKWTLMLGLSALLSAPASSCSADACDSADEVDDADDVDTADSVPIWVVGTTLDALRNKVTSTSVKPISQITYILTRYTACI